MIDFSPSFQRPFCHTALPCKYIARHLGPLESGHTEADRSHALSASSSACAYAAAQLHSLRKKDRPAFWRHKLTPGVRIALSRGAFSRLNGIGPPSTAISQARPQATFSKTRSEADVAMSRHSLRHHASSLCTSLPWRIGPHNNASRCHDFVNKERLRTSSWGALILHCCRWLFPLRTCSPSAHPSRTLGPFSGFTQLRRVVPLGCYHRSPSPTAALPWTYLGLLVLSNAGPGSSNRPCSTFASPRQDAIRPAQHSLRPLRVRSHHP